MRIITGYYFYTFAKNFQEQVIDVNTLIYIILDKSLL
jgi:hypothetical protein